MPRIAQVLLPLPLPEAFDYAEPEGMALALGDLVAVPLGPRQVGGVVVGLRDGAGHNRPLKPVLARLDEPALPPGALAFLDWAADPKMEERKQSGVAVMIFLLMLTGILYASYRNIWRKVGH